MSESLHYTFPPARAYRLNRCLYALKSDDAFRVRFERDADEAMESLRLEPAERAALRAFDRDVLVALGAHPYLVFMAALRIRMGRGAETFEYF